MRIGKRQKHVPLEQSPPPGPFYPGQSPASSPTPGEASSDASTPTERNSLWRRLVRAAVTRRRAAEVLVVAGSLVVGGVGLWFGLTRHGTAAQVVPGTLQAEVLGTDQVSSLLGTTLLAGDSVAAPASAPTVDPTTCAVAAGPGSQAVYTRGWTLFESITYQDSKTDASHTVTQIIGNYGNNGQAAKVFKALAASVKGCTAAEVAGASDISKWTYSPGVSTTDTVTWKSVQSDGGGWACYHHAGLKGNAVMQVTVCEPGDGTAATEAIAGQFADKVGGQ